MPKVLIHAAISLDGFVAGPEDDLSWIFNLWEPALNLSKHVASIGAVIMGRGTHKVDIRERPKPEKNFVYGGSYNGPVFVLSNESNNQEKDPNVQYMSGDITEKIKMVMETANGNNVLLLGPSVWRQCLEARFVDEILIHVIPVLLGDGTHFYSIPGTQLVELELRESLQIGKLAQLKFNVRKLK